MRDFARDELLREHGKNIRRSRIKVSPHLFRRLTQFSLDSHGFNSKSSGDRYIVEAALNSEHVPLINEDLEIEEEYSVFFKTNQYERFVNRANELGVKRGLFLRSLLAHGLDLLQAERLSPNDLRPIDGVSSPFDFRWTPAGTIVTSPSESNAAHFPLSDSRINFSQRLQACEVSCNDLIEYISKSKPNIRSEYIMELKKYAERLPKGQQQGNFLLADAAARTIRNLFANEIDVLPSPIKSSLKTLLEQHMGLRPFFPEIRSFYSDVASSALTSPLPQDAIDGIQRIVKENTPSVFDGSVSSSLNVPDLPISVEKASSKPSILEITPPPDPLGDLDPEKAHNFTISGIYNRIWKTFTIADPLVKNSAAWIHIYWQMAPYVREIINWISQFIGRFLS